MVGVICYFSTGVRDGVLGLKSLVCYRGLVWELLFSFMLEVTVGIGCYCCMSDRSGISL
jgi:hypothetical protein